MRAWGRIALSLVCALTVVIVVGLVARRDPQPWWDWPAAAMIFVLPIWFLTIPFSILLKDAEGKRGVITLLAGNLLAPAGYILFILIQGERPALDRYGSFFQMVLTVSLPTTFLYVILLTLLNHFFFKPKASPTLFQDTTGS